MTELNDDQCCKCGAESTIGCHGLNNGKLFDEYYCDACYNKYLRRPGQKKKREVNED